MPDITHLRRPPVLLPPMMRTIDSTTLSNELSSQLKSMRPQSAEKLSVSSLERQKEKDHTLRYFNYSSHFFI
jgi:hypothetical protein